MNFDKKASRAGAASAADQILAALGGALSGGVRGYTWAKEMDQEDEQQRERERARRDQNNARGVDRMLDERGLMNDEEVRLEAKLTAERKNQIYDEWYATLTPDQQRFVAARKVGGITGDLDDFMESGEQRELAKKDVAGQKYLDDELRHTRSLEAENLRHSNRLSEVQARRRLPVDATTPRDNPALPSAVVAHLAEIANAFDDATEAEYELTSALPELLRAYPRMDPALARRRLAGIYGMPVRPPKPAGPAKPKSDVSQLLWGDVTNDPEFAGRPAATEPQRRGDIALPNERSAPRIPFEQPEALSVATGPSILETRARTLIERYKSEKDSLKRETLRSELKTVRDQLASNRARRQPAPQP